MVIKIGNIFESKAKTLVNTVNCVGVMGKGIAKEFKAMFPCMYNEYVVLCDAGYVQPGRPYLYTDITGASILNFPTKDHWRSPSKLSYIISGLKWFCENYKGLGIESIAFPPLGCGNGGLSWELVGPIMYHFLSALPIDVEIYAPYGTSAEQLTEKYLAENLVESNRDIIGEKGLKFNRCWLLLLYVVQQLNADAYALSVGRTIFQKVCYVVTKAGIPTGFRFAMGSYGPYSKEVKDAVVTLSNANLITERTYGKMIETVVSDKFSLDFSAFSEDEIRKTERAVDLLSRVKSTDHAELLATVLFSHENIAQSNKNVSDADVLNFVLEWKPRWAGRKSEIVDMIHSLSDLGWICVKQTVESGDDGV